MILTIDDARIGRSIVTGEYALPLATFVALAACASSQTPPVEGSEAEDNDLITQLLDRTWAELTIICPDLVERVRRTDGPIDTRWLIRIAQQLTTATNQGEIK